MGGVVSGGCLLRGGAWLLGYRGDMSVGKGWDCLGGRGSGVQLSNDCVVQKTFCRPS